MRLLTASVVGLLLCLPQATQAQYVAYGPYEPYSGVVYNEGPGIKFGHDGLVFHPGLSTELGYDSNVLLSSVPRGAGLLRLRLHFDLATLPPQRQDFGAHPALEFRFGGAFEYRQYLSSDPQINYAYQLNGVSDIDLAIHPRDPFSLRLYNNFVYTSDARNLEVASSQTFTPRVYERIGALAILRPANGPLEIGLGDSFRLDYFIDNQLQGERSVGNEAAAYAQLKVLPQTSVKLEIRSSYINYYNPSAASLVTGVPARPNLVLPSSVPLRVTLGASTLVVPALGLTAYAGYGNSFEIGVDGSSLLTKADTSYNNFLAGAEVRVRLIGRMRLALGYARDFYDSIFASFFTDDRLYLDYDHNLWRGLSARVRFDTYFRSYGTLVDPTFLGYTGYGGNATTRKDVLLNLSAELNYRVLSWMQLGVSYSLLDDITDFTFISPAIGTVNAAFVKHAVLGKIDIAY